MENINYRRGKIEFNKLMIRIAEIFGSFYSYIKLNKSHIKVKGIKGKIPNKGGILIAAHHEEWVDPLVIKKAIKRRLNWVVATKVFGESILEHKFLKKIVDMVGIISIDPERPERNKGLFDYIAYLLEIGEAVVIFPEGNLRNERRGKRLGKFKDGIIRIVKFTKKQINKKIPIYPLGLEYKKRGNVKEAYIKVGNPFFVDDKESIKKAMAKLMKEIARLSNIKNG
jgi:1-acyl-sn-glycerol-3-phosphate acyltransferase